MRTPSQLKLTSSTTVRALAIGAVTAALFAVPSIAEAATGHATGNVNMRACASVNCPKVAFIPAGARLWIGGTQRGWYYVSYRGRQGFVSIRYIATNYADRSRDRDYRRNHRGSPPQFGFWHQPTWDSRHDAWYDGQRWYHNGNWYNNPNSMTFGFTFGG
jgi:uncharacterized protein YraI